jgi:hypothetical protein
VGTFLNEGQNSIQRDCPICRAHIRHLTTSKDPDICNIFFAPGIGYISLKDLLSRTFYNSIGIYWRYFYCPPTEITSHSTRSYLHSLEERGHVSQQGG